MAKVPMFRAQKWPSSASGGSEGPKVRPRAQKSLRGAAEAIYRQAAQGSGYRNGEATEFCKCVARLVGETAEDMGELALRFEQEALIMTKATLIAESLANLSLRKSD